jgi:hypothetical protein
MKKHIVLSILILFIALGSQAQEMLLPLTGNPALKNKAGQGDRIHTKAGAVLTLPFLDDFSINAVYPDSSKWMDDYAFVNRTFGPEPPSVGMATLDVLDDTGVVYSIATPTPFQADYLTSAVIRTDSSFSGPPVLITPADSLYFSFYYQPQGYGNSPDIGDSLILEFYTSYNNKWHKVWQIPGTSYTEFFNQYHRTFRLIMIPITDTTYLKPDFQFRFRNYGSIANSNLPSWQSNMDQWSIDYVYLNIGRSKIDTTFADVTFVEGAPSLLKNYWQMPARQYTSGELKTSFQLKESNLDNVPYTANYRCYINQVGGSYKDSILGGDYNIDPFITNGYQTWPFHATPVVGFTLPTLTNDSTAFDITHILRINGPADNIPQNDTIRYKQTFYNFYAYDDGTPEAGYGLAGVGSRMAYEFTLNQPDTLGAVQMFFNQTYTPPSSRYFYLMVWQTLTPEVLLYKSTRLKPINGDSLNAFHTYFISDSLIMLSGTFYIGMQQITDEVLNLGFDLNTDHSDKLYYNTEGFWQNTVYSGSIMMRPVFGTAGQSKKMELPDGINELTVKLFPNPVYYNELNFTLPDKYRALDPEQTMTIEIFNYIGSKVMEVPYSDKISLANLPLGYYLLRLNSYSTGESCVKSFIITR